MVHRHDTGHDWLIKQVESLVQGAVDENFVADPISRLAPFVEVMGTWPGGNKKPYDSKKEFWWEREWRHRGNLVFSIEDVAVVFCPEEDMGTVDGTLETLDSKRFVRTIDPTWGLEHIIKRLADLE